MSYYDLQKREKLQRKVLQFQKVTINNFVFVKGAAIHFYGLLKVFL